MNIPALSSFPSNLLDTQRHLQIYTTTSAATLTTATVTTASTSSPRSSTYAKSVSTRFPGQINYGRTQVKGEPVSTTCLDEETIDISSESDSNKEDSDVATEEAKRYLPKWQFSKSRKKADSTCDQSSSSLQVQLEIETASPGLSRIKSVNWSDLRYQDKNDTRKSDADNDYKLPPPLRGTPISAHAPNFERLSSTEIP